MYPSSPVNLADRGSVTPLPLISRDTFPNTLLGRGTTKDNMAQDITAGATHLTANGHLPFPPEVRNIIYGHIFAPPQDPDNLETVMFGNNFVNGQRCWLKLDGQHAHYSLQPPDLPPFNEEVLSLLLVSKQTYLETFHMFYETNEFGFCTIDLLTQFLRRI